MRNKKPNAELAWKRLEDIVVPHLRLTPFERSIYSHLLRHSRLEGRRRLRFSMNWLARSAGVSAGVRKAVRRLAAKRVLRMLQRNYYGHVVEVFLPDEICALRHVPRHPSVFSIHFDLETADFLQTRRLRSAIYRRDAGRCFYCLRYVPRPQRCLDHVVPAVRNGSNSYRNLVSSCLECNARKGKRSAADHLRRLFRCRRLTSIELSQRLKALRALANGKLKPAFRQHRWANGPAPQSIPAPAFVGKPGRAARGCPRFDR